MIPACFTIPVCSCIDLDGYRALRMEVSKPKYELITKPLRCSHSALSAVYYPGLDGFTICFTICLCVVRT
jgi:hypothetical protein